MAVIDTWNWMSGDFDRCQSRYTLGDWPDHRLLRSWLRGYAAVWITAGTSYLGFSWDITCRCIGKFRTGYGIAFSGSEDCCWYQVSSGIRLVPMMTDVQEQDLR